MRSFFHPWRGPNYGAASVGRRIAIMGEAHYGYENANNPAHTQEVVLDWARAGKGKRKFFTAALKTVRGISKGVYVTKEQREVFWDEVVFFNFVQDIPGDNPWCRPSREMWERANEPFLRTLDELKPEIMVVLGKDVGQHLPRECIPPSIRVCCVLHPSFPGFRLEDAQNAFRKVLEG